jgi:PEP-CTERM motif
MVRLSTKGYLFGAMALSASFACLAPTEAAFNGNPIGGMASVTDGYPNNYWTSSLYPNPAIQEANCVWITQGLTAQGFTQANGWTVNTGVALTGSLSLEKYFAYVTTQPIGNINGTNFGGAGAYADYGGAELRVLYTPGAGDPTGNSVHWMQAIYTNSAISAGAQANAYNYGNGYYAYLDNAGTYGTNPDYDNNVGTNPTTSTEFLDIPGRDVPPPLPPNSISWYAQVFIDTFNPTTKTINVYTNGVYWGFNLSDVPEPGPFGLLALGLVGLVLRRRKRSAA